MKQHKIKKKLIVPLIAAFLVLWLLAVMGIYFIQSNSITQDAEYEYKNVETIIEGKVKSDVIQLRFYIDYLQKNVDFASEFKHGQQEVYNKIKPFFIQAQSSINLANILLIKPDNTVFLRMDSLNLFGDTIRRFSFQKSKELKRAYFFIEPGKNGDLKIRVVVPVLNPDQSIAFYIEVNKTLESVFSFFEDVTHMDFTLIVSKQIFNGEHWANNHEFFYDNLLGDDSIAIYYSSLKGLSKSDIRSILKDDNTPEINKINISGKNYLSKTLELKNINDSPFAQIKVLHDNSGHEKDLFKGILLFSIISFVILVIILLVFYQILQRVEKRLLKFQNDLGRELKMRKAADIKLINANAELRRLTFMAAHDLKAPITNLQGLMQLAELNANEEQVDIFNKMNSSITSLREIIEGINKVIDDVEDTSIKIEVVSVVEVFNNVCDSISNLIAEKDIEVITDFEVKEITIYTGHLKSILQNLLSNSIKYCDLSKPKRFVKVKVSRIEENQIAIEVEDNGIGIDMDVHGQKVFGLFKRFHSGYGGKGIGLFLVKMIAERYGGSVEIKSIPGIGTIILVKLSTEVK